MLDRAAAVWCREGVDKFWRLTMSYAPWLPPVCAARPKFSDHKFGIFGFRSPKIPDFTLIWVRVFPTSRDGNGRMKSGIFYHFSH